MVKKYVRIQGREISYRTGKPKGIFAMCWRMLYDGVFSTEDAQKFKTVEIWFKENLPEPNLYENDNPLGVITYFKMESTKDMLENLNPLCDLLDQYNHAYDIVYTDYVGSILYEDEYQVAVIDRKEKQNED